MSHDVTPTERWLLWADGEHAPAANMALDEALLMTAGERAIPLLRFYRWDRPAVSIGYVQRFPEGLARNYAVVRRPTGGGVVFHDHDFTYAVVVPPGHALDGLDRMRSYDCINRAVLCGLERLQMQPALARQDMASKVDRASMVCFQIPTRYDILLDGRKVAGSAQRRTNTGILHQGSIHFGGPMPVSRQQLATALRAGFTEVLRASLEPFDPPAALLQLAQHLERTRYGTDQWNQKR